MQWQPCGRENRSTARFCDTCGVELAILVEGPAQPTPGPEDDSPVAGFQNLMASPLFREDLASSQFVGRHREMELLNAALDQASYGHGRLVMLVGEPGIGKTRTAQEFVDQARAAGAQALWGWCYEDQGAPPYWPWIQPIRQLVQQAQREQLQAWMGPGAASIAEIVPEVREKLPGLEPLPGLEAGQARFRCFDGIVGLFKRVAQERPLVIVLDDLHYADSSSLLLLEFIAQQLEGASLLLVGTYRDMAVTRSHPLARALGSLVRAPGFQRLQLKRLTHQDVGEFIAVSSEDPTPEPVQTVYERTGGNLLFPVEVVRLLAQEGGGLASDTLIPEGVRDAIGTRLNSLSALCNETLTMPR
jgi:predicted ATPase